MSQKQSVFHDNWRDCLREHYLYVVRTHDAITEPTLRRVLIDTGFTEAEIDQLHEEGLLQAEQISNE